MANKSWLFSLRLLAICVVFIEIYKNYDFYLRRFLFWVKQKKFYIVMIGTGEV